MSSLLLLGMIALVPQSAPPTLAEWRSAREASLKKPTGWLSVAGLFWLKPGESGLGSGAENLVQLPASAAAKVGTLTVSPTGVALKVAEGQTVLVNGKAVTEADLKSDAKGADTVQIGDLMFRIIERGGRIGVRLYDPHAETQREFKGLHWYPGQDKWIVKAKYTAYPKPQELPITNVLGDTAPVSSPGFVTFKVGGKEVKLVAEDAGDGLFFNFKDLTNGKATYLAGRFLDAEKPKDGFVTLDFNRATNPPCAYTAYATCPLAPKQNYLPVEIPAGEKGTH